MNVSVWGLRRTGTNLVQMLVDEHTSADPIQHEDAWKHGYPYQTTPGAVNLVVAKHPLAWIQSREAWDHGGRGSLSNRLVRLAEKAANLFHPTWTASARWGMPLDLYAIAYRSWLDLDRVHLLRYEDLLQDPGRALSVLEHDGIHVDVDIRLPTNRITPTNNGPKETPSSFDASYYTDHEWADHYTIENLHQIQKYVHRHGHRSLWNRLAYQPHPPFTSRIVGVIPA